MEAKYAYTSGKMLHLEGCSHFFDEQPARLATDEELAALPVCDDCMAQDAPAKKTPPKKVAPTRKKTVADVPGFVCQNCFRKMPMNLQMPDGKCEDCAG